VPYTTSADYPAIRAVLDVTVTPARLPDDVIAAIPNVPSAEAEVARRLGEVVITAGAVERAKAAVILLTAARLVPSVPQIVQRRLGNSLLHVQPRDIDKRVQELRRQAVVEISAAKVLEAPVGTIVVVPPPTFVLAGGGRYTTGNPAEGASGTPA